MAGLAYPLCVRRPLDATAVADRAAFHRHIAEINGRRLVGLALATAALLSTSFIANIALNGLSNFSFVTGTGVNVTGLLLVGVVLLFNRFGPPGWSAIIYGCLVLA